MMALYLLVAEHLPLGKLFAVHFGRLGIDTALTSDYREAAALLHSDRPFDALVIDVPYPPARALAFIRCVQSHHPALPVIVTTRTYFDPAMTSRIDRRQSIHWLYNPITAEDFQMGLDVFFRSRAVSAYPLER